VASSVPLMPDSIRIARLSTDCVIGVRPQEREREQPVLLDLELRLPLQRAGRSGKIAHTVDYDRVAREVTALLRFRRFRLIEAAAEEISAMLLGVHKAITSLQICLSKPHALEHARAASVILERSRSDYRKRAEDTDWGQAEVLLESRDAGLYLLHVEPGREIPRHRHRVMRELEWLVDGQLWREDDEVEPLVPVAWRPGEVHSYHNRGNRRATLFCCDCPPFIPTDEILVEGDP
jgi:FolB domain-containing protein